jgi:hypothetical protein
MLRAVSETLVNIFQLSGHSREWLMALVEDEIDIIERECLCPGFGSVGELDPTTPLNPPVTERKVFKT